MRRHRSHPVNPARKPWRSLCVLCILCGGMASLGDSELPIRNEKGQIQWQATLSAIFPKDTSTEKCEYTPLVTGRPRLRGVQLPARSGARRSRAIR